MILFLVGAQTGGVTIVVGTVVLALGVALSSGKSLRELFTPNVRGVFEETFNAFKSGHAGHFPELKEAIEKVEAAFKAAALYDLNDQDYEAYQQRLEAIGFQRSGSFE